MRETDYVLVTAARNEEQYIEETIRTVISQTIQPKKWIIVSDGSTDGTDEIVKQYGRDYSFIELLRTERDATIHAGQAPALMAGCEQLRDVQYSFIGMLDADITLESDYYESILARFQESPRLGVAGGSIRQSQSGTPAPSICAADSVPGGIQFYRRQAFEDSGGFISLKRGGHDAVAEATARMHGWQVRSFPELTVLHHRPCGACYGNALRIRFNLGIREYAYGNHPLFQLAKSFYRIKEKPYLLGSAFRLCGYCWAFIRREPREVPADVIRYLRREQMQKLWHVVSSKNN